MRLGAGKLEGGVIVFLIVEDIVNLLLVGVLKDVVDKRLMWSAMCK